VVATASAFHRSLPLLFVQVKFFPAAFVVIPIFAQLPPTLTAALT
jgi:hypothetical protein